MAAITPRDARQLAAEHRRQGRLAEAELLYGQLCALFPLDAELACALAELLWLRGAKSEAAIFLERAVRLAPDRLDCQMNFAVICTELGRIAEAVTAGEAAVRLAPSHPATHYNLGNAYNRARRWPEAVESYRAALRLQPEHLEAVLNLGIALNNAGDAQGAMGHYREAMSRFPDEFSLANNLGNLLRQAVRMEEAIEVYTHALKLAPESAAAASNLGDALMFCGDAEEAARWHRHALTLAPGLPEIHSNLILTSYYLSGTTSEELEQLHSRWRKSFCDPLSARRTPHAIEPDSDRRLRVGFVSPDLRNHVVGRAVLPVIERLDRSRFEVTCYAKVTAPDALTSRFRAAADRWHDVFGWHEERLENVIRADRIDILIDLALHTAYHSLLTFARKPAPVQVTWLGYPGSTGLDTIDYRISDRRLEPEGDAAAWMPEAPLLLPHCWTCYRPDEAAPAPSAPPMRDNGFITFGSFNKGCKVTREAVELWARILHRVERSKLHLLDHSAAERARLQLRFAEHGIEAGRLIFSRYYLEENGMSRSAAAEFYRRYHAVDIALDPFPYNGMTTTCDALWMGVPVVALRGAATIARASYSLLANVGLDALAAETLDDYVSIAVELAANGNRLAELRSTLREQMARSPLLDEEGFARGFETAMQDIWRAYCRRYNETTKRFPL